MEYNFPSLELLKYYNPKNDFTNREYVQNMGKKLAAVFESFKINCKITETRMTPFAVLFDVMPDPGVSVKTFRNLRLDLEVHMTLPIEIVSTGDQKYTVGVALKNWERPVIGLRDIMNTKAFKDNKYILPVAAGMNVLGEPFVFDLATTPHLLVAGTTGSGKSTFLNDIILSILYTRTPEEVNFIMIDPKGVELNAYRPIPHMAKSIVRTPDKALKVFKWVDKEMVNRYDKFAALGVKNIDDFNNKVPKTEKLPRIVIIVDEYMEMMFEASKEVEEYIKRLSRLARASGMHLVLATQRPSSDVITGAIKANIPCRASFTVVDWRESKTIIDRTGAERLLGNGDMLFSLAESAVPVHCQAAYVSYDEVDKVIEAVSL